MYFRKWIGNEKASLASNLVILLVYGRDCTRSQKCYGTQRRHIQHTHKQPIRPFQKTAMPASIANATPTPRLLDRHGTRQAHNAIYFRHACYVYFPPAQPLHPHRRTLLLPNAGYRNSYAGNIFFSGISVRYWYGVETGS